MKIRLAVTGSSGYLAQELIRRLGGDPECELLLGLDIRPRAPERQIPFEFAQFDLTQPWENLAALFRKHSINRAMHLAWQFNPIHDVRRHRQVDIEGSHNFFNAAAAAAVKRVIYAGSTTAYVNPANPSSPPFLAEDTPVSGTPNYLYSKHKAEVDRMAQTFMVEHPEIQTLIFRGAIVLGAHTQNIVSKMIDWPWTGWPWMAQVRGADPPMQYISEEDTGEILFRAVKSDVTGIFNFAGDGAVRFSELARAAGKNPMAIPAGLLYPLTGLLWALRLSPFPAGILDMIRYPWVADNTRLKTVFGFAPRHTSRQALEAFLAARRARG